jgi:uncharacterized ParB-like nuclease family protein
MVLKTALAIVTLTLLSCGSTEKQTQTSTDSETNTTVSETNTISTNTNTNTETMDPQKLMAEGYLQGTIVYSDKEGDCPYTIQMPGDKMEFYYLDPVNLEEKFKKDGQKVWIKFNGLRRMNRCDKATPAEITAIKKGE